MVTEHGSKLITREPAFSLPLESSFEMRIELSNCGGKTAQNVSAVMTPEPLVNDVEVDFYFEGECARSAVSDFKGERNFIKIFCKNDDGCERIYPYYFDYNFQFTGTQRESPFQLLANVSNCFDSKILEISESFPPFISLFQEDYKEVRGCPGKKVEQYFEARVFYLYSDTDTLMCIHYGMPDQQCYDTFPSARDRFAISTNPIEFSVEWKDEIVPAAWVGSPCSNNVTEIFNITVGPKNSFAPLDRAPSVELDTSVCTGSDEVPFQVPYSPSSDYHQLSNYSVYYSCNDTRGDLQEFLVEAVESSDYKIATLIVPINSTIQIQGVAYTCDGFGTPMKTLTREIGPIALSEYKFTVTQESKEYDECDTQRKRDVVMNHDMDPGLSVFLMNSGADFQCCVVEESQDIGSCVWGRIGGGGTCDRPTELGYNYTAIYRLTIPGCDDNHGSTSMLSRDIHLASVTPSKPEIHAFSALTKETGYRSDTCRLSTIFEFPNEFEDLISPSSS
eukprot:gb/GECH01008478.1/.p1 GENE.gb/GECH01008478.1/~~gb/GECH01008478.1/.p1  ORF type:complete len:505 (+),score=68.71 gb/GECH01008478.1/:1-1515(+)